MARGSRRRGLVVGCCYPHSKLELLGPDADIVFYEEMLRSFGFNEVRVLSDRKLGLESSQRGNILRGAQWLVEGAMAGDSLAFIFSGHGAGVHNGGDRRDDLERGLLAADLELPFPANVVNEDELQTVFASLRPGVLLTCILDCPFGDGVVKTPWLYEARAETYVPPMKVPRKSSMWPGSRLRKVGADRLVAPRGSPISASRAVPLVPADHPRSLAAGVLAFVLCACRADQVCFSSSFSASRGSGTWQGVFTSSLAQVLSEALRPSFQPGSRSGCPLSYSGLAAAVHAAVQEKLSNIPGLEGLGVEQTLLLGCTADPDRVSFLEPPQLGTASVLPESVVSVPRPIRSTADHAAVSACLAAGESGELRWARVLVQLCRLSRPHKPLSTAEVIGEFWLPPVAQLFPEQALPGDPVTRPSGKAGEARGLRRELWWELREPPPQAQRRLLTWNAALPHGLVECCTKADAGDDEESDAFALFPSTTKQPRPRTGAKRKLEQMLAVARRRGVDLRVPLGRLEEMAATQQEASTAASMTSMEFEYFAVRYLGLELSEARSIFADCSEAVTIAAILEVLQEFTLAARRGVHSTVNGPIEVWLDLEFSSAAVGTGLLRFRALELRQRGHGAEPAQAFRQLRTPRALETARTQQQKPQPSRGRSCLLPQKNFSLRAGLCASSDVVDRPGTPRRLGSESSSWVLPHIVYVTPPLLQGTDPDSGEPFLRLDTSPNSGHLPPWLGGHVDAAMPLFATEQLCKAQRTALNVPYSATLERCLSPRKAAPSHTQLPGTQKVLPLLPSLRLAHTSSEPYIPSPIAVT